MLPPEINSALIFAGAGSGRCWPAASAWDGLAAGSSAAVSFLSSVTAGLVGRSWQEVGHRRRWRQAALCRVAGRWRRPSRAGAGR